LESENVGTEQTLEDLSTPRQLGEELDRGERNVEIEADAMDLGLIPQHLWNELKLIVLDPGDVSAPEIG
jgi:hypothetical protein